MSYPPFIQSRQHKYIFDTGGSNIVANTSGWEELAAESGGPGTGSYDVTLSNLQIGDVCMAGFALVFGNQAVAAYLDVHTVVSGVRVSSFASQGTDLTPSPNGAWYAEASRLVTLGPSIPYTITSGDIDANQRTTFRPMIYTASASNRTVFNQNESLFFWVSNIGPQDTT